MKEHHKPMITDGCWRIVKNNIQGVTWLPFMQHKCGPGNGVWSWFAYAPEERDDVRCHVCHEAPPDGLVATLVFLKVGE